MLNSNTGESCNGQHCGDKETVGTEHRTMKAGVMFRKQRISKQYLRKDDHRENSNGRKMRKSSSRPYCGGPRLEDSGLSSIQELVGD